MGRGESVVLTNIVIKYSPLLCKSFSESEKKNLLELNPSRLLKLESNRGNYPELLHVIFLDSCKIWNMFVMPFFDDNTVFDKNQTGVGS